MKILQALKKYGIVTLKLIGTGIGGAIVGIPLAIVLGMFFGLFLGNWGMTLAWLIAYPIMILVEAMICVHVWKWR